jgi:predicted nucleic acid-binding protein
MNIVETTVWVDALNGVSNRQTEWLSANLSSGNIALTDLIVCEVLRGLRGDEARYRKARAYLQEFVVFDTGGKDIAIASAENYRFLRVKGHTVRSAIDCIIATYCIREGHSLIHHDRDYDSFERYLGLKVIHA